ncbi:MAG: DUF2059 domain-containing protein [Armatimonadetes bacterium]|nr:DUF2059 domain-containing protein [Armatimonadota bacterium]
MRTLAVVLWAAVALAGTLPLRAQTPTQTAAVSPEKEKAIRQLLDVVGTAKLMDQMMDQMLTSFHGSFPDVPPEVWTKLRARMKTENMITLIIPVYDKYYTTEDINGLLAFYQTPLGQKVIATLPQVSRESMAIGQAWGQKQAQSVIRELERQEKASKQHSKPKVTPLP